MEHLQRNIFITLFVAVVGIIGFVLFSKAPNKTIPPPVIDGNLPTTSYSSTDGITLTYPVELSLSEKDKVITLNHEIPYKNTGACDMIGDEKTYDMLTDFHVTLRIASTSLVKTVRQMSSYIPEENFDGDVLKVNPGFIDSFEAGSLNGFAIYEGAEGCGMTTHYFPLPGNRTLIIQKESIQALSGVQGETLIKEILAVPGAISKEESEMMFISIVNSLTIK